MNKINHHKILNHISAKDLIHLRSIFSSKFYQNGTSSYRTGFLHAMYLWLPGIDYKADDFESFVNFITNLSDPGFAYLVTTQIIARPPRRLWQRFFSKSYHHKETK